MIGTHDKPLFIISNHFQPSYPIMDQFYAVLLTLGSQNWSFLVITKHFYQPSSIIISLHSWPSWTTFCVIWWLLAVFTHKIWWSIIDHYWLLSFSIVDHDQPFSLSILNDWPILVTVNHTVTFAMIRPDWTWPLWFTSVRRHNHSITHLTWPSTTDSPPWTIIQDH